MRVAAGLVLSGFTAFVAASSAAIYELNAPIASQVPLHASFDDAELGLALVLGVSRHYKLGTLGSDARRIEVLERLAELAGRTGVSYKDEGRFILSISGIGMEDAGGLSLNQPLLVMKDTTGSKSACELVRELAEAGAMDVRSSLQEIVSHQSSFCVVTGKNRDIKKIDSIEHSVNYEFWRVGKESKDVTAEIVKVLKPNRSKDDQFVKEYFLFNDFVDQVASRSDMHNSSAFCHFEALADLVSKYSHDSTEVRLAISLYRATISRLSSPGIQTTLLLTPGALHKSASVLRKREEEEPISKTADRTKAIPKPAAEVAAEPEPEPEPPQDILKRCHESNQKCTAATGSCSSHGACKEARKGCWTCQCEPTTKDLGNGKISTTYWGGVACQKQDISVPFNIFFLLTVALVILIAGAVKMLNSIGNEGLPGVLSVGTAPPKRS